jgi:MoxR-like ATPase
MARSTSTDVLSKQDFERTQTAITAIRNAFSATVVGQEALRESMLAALIAGGHILLESAPGLAKTTAAHALADAVKADFKRIQCTPDLLPSDITGTQILDARTSEFTTVLGPVHANIVLLDEINRSSAKTQSAMLEAMQEKQTTIGGKEYKLPSPFLVIATQNPIEQEGTYPLPEAQLDRFLLKEVLDYPNQDQELEILSRMDRGVFDADQGKSPLTLDDVRFLQQAAEQVYVADSVREYLVAIVQATRNVEPFLGPEWSNLVEMGASPRASIAFLKATRARALLEGRDHVLPEDVRALRHSVLRHRVLTSFEADAVGVKSERIIDELIARVPTP